MAVEKHDRAAHFPKIEAKYGQPMKYWFGVMKEIADRKYPEQIAFLKEEHRFSSKRFDDFAGFLEKHDAIKQKTLRKVFRVIQKKYPKLDLVIAWNQPMLKLGTSYVFGASVAKNHILIAPFNEKVLKSMSQDLEGYKVNKKTVQVPVDWKVDERLLLKMIQLNLKALKS